MPHRLAPAHFGHEVGAEARPRPPRGEVQRGMVDPCPLLLYLASVARFNDGQVMLPRVEPERSIDESGWNVDVDSGLEL